MRPKVAGLLGLLVLMSAFGGSQVQAAKIKVLHRFSPLVAASQNPGSLVRGTDGNFYGLSAGGGANGTGTVFKLTPAGTLTTLHSFGALDDFGNNIDGISPSVRLVQGTDGNLYGTAFQGGANNTGTIFKVSPAGVFTTLENFGPIAPDDTNPGGAYPRAGLIQGTDGNFYGTTSSGGANGRGVVFRVAPEGTLTTLHTFSALDPSYNNADGTSPYAALVQGTDGVFYGVTNQGGANGAGTAFKITPAGAFTTLHSFSPLDGNSGNDEGAQPLAALIQGRDGNFYGLAGYGGAGGQGTIFQLTPQGTVTALHSFSGNEGSLLFAALTQGNDGNFYGVANGGGANGAGTVFQFVPGGTLTTLHTFNGVDGQGPASALVLDTDGGFYGVANAGGVYNGGTFFRLAPGGAFAKLSNFGLISNNEGARSFAPLARGADGDFYGTTNSGGGNGSGTIFKVTPTGDTIILHSFSARDDNFTNNDGAFPSAGLVQGLDGNFYGTAAGGGASGTGTIFKVTPAGIFTTLSSFGLLDENFSNQDGAYPAAALVPGSDGNLYGTATAGGINGSGTIFKFTPTGEMTVLHSFGAVDASNTNEDGTYPNASLTPGNDGNFYGLARFGGLGGTGTIFRVTPGGGFTTLSSFPTLDDGNYNQSGAFPTDALVQGADGNFYGTAGYGGVRGAGVAFQVTPTGTLNILHAFGTLDANYHNTDGVDPEAGLVQGRDGSFYGTTRRGSTNEGGTIFKLTSGGTLTTLFSFGDGGGGAGANPYASLVQGKGGSLFGTTINGGNGAGTIFRVTIQPSLLAPVSVYP